MPPPSSKTAVMTDSPKRETERSWVRRGRPRMAIASGWVTNFSTSRGDIPGAEDRTSTWMFVTSGKASMGSPTNDQMPKPATRRTQTTTRLRLWSEPSMSLLIMLMFIPPGLLQHLGLEEEAPRRYDFVPLG